MPDYTLGKVYKLINSINSKIYIGSTAYPYLTDRFRTHKNSIKDTSSRRQSLLNVEMRTLGIDKFSIELIEKYSCASRIELATREQYWMDELKPELNEFRAIADPDYEKTRRDPTERKERRKKYYETHKDKILSNCKEYRERPEVAALIKERKLKYRERPEVAAHIKERKSRKCTCECGMEITISHKPRHCQSQFHKKYLQQLSRLIV